jgi:PAS domain S-box-containing protein
MLGYSSFEELSIRNLSDCGFECPYQRKEFIDEIEKNGTVKYLESKWLRHDGSTIIVNEIATGIHDSKGNIIYYDGMVEEITVQKRVEKELQESEEIFRLITECSADAIFISDKQGKYLYVNSRAVELLGYSKEDMLTMSIPELAPKNNADELMEHLEIVLKDGSSFFELDLLKKDGQIAPVDLNAVVLPNGLVYASCRDITERKRIEEVIKLKNEELRIRNIEKDKFLTIISHDLRSPFQGFLQLTKYLAEEAASFSVKQLSELGAGMHSEANKIFQLLKNLLDWAKMQKGEMLFQPKICLISALIEDNIETMKERCRQKKIKVVNLVSGPVIAFVDEKMVTSVILNLLSNAIKFTGQDGTITINSDKTINGMIQISIADTGVGMNKNLVEKLFRLGQRTGRLGTEGELSSGLGLMLCKEFVEKHNGEIRVESLEGKGSTFYFTLPIVEVKLPH